MIHHGKSLVLLLIRTLGSGSSRLMSIHEYTTNFQRQNLASLSNDDMFSINSMICQIYVSDSQRNYFFPSPHGQRPRWVSKLFQARRVLVGKFDNFTSKITSIIFYE